MLPLTTRAEATSAWSGRWREFDIERTRNPDYDSEFDLHLDTDCRTELLVDEADRLMTSGLEQLRDFFDRHDLGMILIGMPGFDR